jgi:hypothetical protein
MLPFCITKEDIQQGIEEWPDYLKPTLEDELKHLETRMKRNQERKRA